MKKGILFLMTALLIFVLASCSSNNSDDGGKVLVKTDAGNITQADLYKELKKSEQGQQMLQQLVYMKILKKKYEVTDKELDQRLKEMKEQAGGEEAFKMFMQQQGITDENEIKDQLKQSLYLFKATTDGVKVSDKKVEDYYKKNKDDFTTVKASHILLKKKSTANSIAKKLKKGADFSKMAKKESEDKATAKEGGSLGELSKQSQDIDQTFLLAAMKLKKGEVSDPIKTQFGYHIIKADDKKVKPLKEVKSQIEQTLLQQEAKPTQEVLNDLNKKIEVKDKAFKDAFKDQKPEEQTQQGQG